MNEKENLKKEGTEIINNIAKDLENISTCKITFFYFVKQLKCNSIEKYEKIYMMLLKRVNEYNKKIDNSFPLGLAQQVDTIYTIPLFNLQREQMQDLLNELANNISSKRMQLNFMRSLSISILALIIALFSLIFTKFLL
jgi:hypothetical protein